MTTLKKNIFLFIGTLSVIFLTLLSGYGFVFGNTASSNTSQTPPQIRFVSDLGRTIYLDNDDLRTFIVAYRSSIDLSQASLHSSCELSSRYLFSYKDISFFEGSYTSENCANSSIALRLGDMIYTQTLASLTHSNKARELSVLLDMSDANLQKLDRELAKKLKSVALYRNFSGTLSLQNISQYIKKYQALEIYYTRSLISEILGARQKKYISPVPGYFLQKQANKIPNAGRPYRAAYTDGIHHGWDIDAPIGTSVVALDDGIIVRIKRDFSDADFEKIIYGESLDYEQKLENLNILRGNQVWLKTMKGEVIFYSHLSEVSSDLETGVFVKKGTFLGNVGISGVPGSGYEDYHLHFDVKIPSYSSGKEGQYSDMDYMKWPWSGKGQAQSEVLGLIDMMFEQNYDTDSKK